MSTSPSRVSSSPGQFRVSLDARCIGLAGIGRMIEGLWQGLLDLGADVIGLSPGGRSRDWMSAYRTLPRGPHVSVAARPFLPGEQVVLPMVLRRLRTDVHHAPHCTVPYLTRQPLVVTVHDLFPYLDRANARSPAAAAAYRVAIPLSIRRADLIVAVSPYTARSVAETFGVGESRLRVVEHGLNLERWQPPTLEEVTAVRARYGLPSDYLLYVGTTKRHKNMKTLLAAHRPTHPALVVVGPGAADLERAGFRISDHRNVIPIGRVPDNDLAALYGGALALLLPSLYEAVGFPALEAMACGTPVVASDGGGLPDTVGGGGILVPALDVAAWAEALTLVSEDESLRQRLASSGRAAMAGRSWRTAASQYLDIYREAAG